MSLPAVPANLIISLSNDKVMIDLEGLPNGQMVHWRSAFEVQGIFEEEKISRSLDDLMVSRPELMEPFNSVDVLLVDRPHIQVPSYYVPGSRLASVASNHLRLRAGDMLQLDHTGHPANICYTVPAATIQMLREYYANITVMHFTSVLWYQVAAMTEKRDDHTVYFNVFGDHLIVLGCKSDQLLFTKTFTVREPSDIAYYVVACRHMLKAKSHCLLTIKDEVNSVSMPGEEVCSFDDHQVLPSLSDLLAQYRTCVS